MKTDQNETQILNLKQVELQAIATKLREAPYTKFQVLAADGAHLLAIISIEALKIVELVFTRNVEEAKNMHEDTVAHASLKELESLGAGPTTVLRLAAARATSAG